MQKKMRKNVRLIIQSQPPTKLINITNNLRFPPGAIMFKIIAASSTKRQIPIGIVTKRISSLRPSLLVKRVPIKFEIAITTLKNKVESKRSRLESPPKPASFMIDGP